MNSDPAQTNGNSTDARAPRTLGALPLVKVQALDSWKHLRRFYRNKLAILGTLLLSLAIFGAVFAPILSPHDPFRQDISRRLQPPGTSTGPGRPNYLGTDQLGRDLLSRIVYGTRVSLLVSSLSVALASSLGTLLGLFTAYYGGPFDAFLMRLADLQLSFPFILLALPVLGFLGTTMKNLVILFVIAGWPIYARTIRASAMSLKRTDLIESARAIGLNDLLILTRYILINSISPIVVLTSFDIGRVILLESALGFLGLGVQPPTPTWGNMLSDGRDYIFTAWWLALFPGLAIMFTILSANLLGDALRDYLDPTMRGR